MFFQQNYNYFMGIIFTNIVQRTIPLLGNTISQSWVIPDTLD